MATPVRICVPRMAGHRGTACRATGRQPPGTLKGEAVTRRGISSVPPGAPGARRRPQARLPDRRNPCPCDWPCRLDRIRSPCARIGHTRRRSARSRRPHPPQRVAFFCALHLPSLPCRQPSTPSSRGRLCVGSITTLHFGRQCRRSEGGAPARTYASDLGFVHTGPRMPPAPALLPPPVHSRHRGRLFPAGFRSASLRHTRRG